MWRLAQARPDGQASDRTDGLDRGSLLETDLGERVDFDLGEFERNGAIEVVEVALPALKTFLSQFDASYAEKLDPGEAESLAYLLAANADTHICSADGIVFRVLGNLDRGQQGLSLEEVLQSSWVGAQGPQPVLAETPGELHGQGR